MARNPDKILSRPPRRRERRLGEMGEQIQRRIALYSRIGRRASRRNEACASLRGSTLSAYQSGKLES